MPLPNGQKLHQCGKPSGQRYNDTVRVCCSTCWAPLFQHCGSKGWAWACMSLRYGQLHSCLATSSHLQQLLQQSTTLEKPHGGRWCNAATYQAVGMVLMMVMMVMMV